MNKSNVIIYDWDDTLFPTTVITSNKYNNFSSEVSQVSYLISNIDNIKSEIKHLDILIQKLLEKSSKLGYTIIITNATRSWIRETASKYYPNTFQYMMNNNIPVISAREYSNNNNINNMNEWKNATFKYFLTTFINKNSNISNIISIGDSLFEKNALNNFGYHINRHQKQVNIKTVKYINNPNVQNVLKENILLYKNIDKIVLKDGNSDIYLQQV